MSCWAKLDKYCKCSDTCILLSVSFCMSYNHVYKAIYCTYIEYALLCNVKMICERRANAGIGLCRYAGRSWPLLSAKYKYKHVAFQRCCGRLAVVRIGMRRSGTVAIRAEEQWYGPPQRLERALTWSGLDTCSTVDLFSYACPQTVLCITHLYIYYCIRERERERKRERDSERESTYLIESIIILIQQFSVIPNFARCVEAFKRY